MMPNNSSISILFIASLIASQALLAADTPWRVNDLRLNEHLQTFGKISAEVSLNTSRLAYSETDVVGRAYIVERMQAAGLETKIDAAGNILGRRAGQNPELPVIMLGSHSDSVPNGGLYDGPVGVFAAIEVAQTLQEQNHITQHSLEIVVFQNEESGKTGSHLITSGIMPKEFELPTASGKTIAEGITALGGDLDRLDSARRNAGSVAAFLELHIEQGATLDDRGIAIGVVEGIVGIKRWNITVDGFANHAGTTPMNKRQDALLAAAKLVDAVNQITTGMPGQQVGTVGNIQAYPGAANVVAGKVTLSLEIRDLDMEKIDRIYKRIELRAQNIARTTNTKISFDHIYISHSALTNPNIKKTIAGVAKQLELSTTSLPSGAGHDAQSIAKIAPIGMIFVPSKDGISHSPREFTSSEDITNGANVLLHTLLRIDQSI